MAKDQSLKKKSINDKLIKALIDFIIGLLLLIINKMIEYRGMGKHHSFINHYNKYYCHCQQKMSNLRFLGIFFIAAGCAKMIWYLVEQKKG